MPIREQNSSLYTMPVRPIEQQPAPSIGDVVSSAFQLENDVVNAVEFLRRKRFQPEEDFNLERASQGYEQYILNNPDAFVDVDSTDEFLQTVSRIDRENKLRETVARAGWSGVAASIGAGVLSPTIFIPAVGPSRGMAAIAEGALLSASAAVGQEAVLAGNQLTRTDEDIAMSLAAGTVLGGLIGGGIGYLRSGERAAGEIGLIGTAERTDVTELPMLRVTDEVEASVADVGPTLVRNGARYDLSQYDAGGRLGQGSREVETLNLAEDARIVNYRQLSEELPRVRDAEVREAMLRANEPTVKMFEGLRETKRALTEQIREATLAHTAEVREKLLTATGRRAAKLRNDLAELQEGVQNIPEVQRLRQRLIRADERMRDLATDVSALRRDAELRVDRRLGDPKQLRQTLAKHFDAIEYQGRKTSYDVLNEDKLVQGRRSFRDPLETLIDAAAKGGYSRIELPDGRIYDIPEAKFIELEEAAAIDQAIPAPGKPSSAGAAANVSEGAGGLKGLFGTKTGYGPLAKISPVTRMLTQNVSEHARWVQGQLGRAGLRLEGNAKGIATAEQGTIEARIRTYDKRLYDALVTIRDAYRDYARKNPPNKLSRADFNREISRAVWSGKEYDGLQEAKNAADVISKKYYEPIGQEASDVGLFDVLGVIGDPRYLNRVFDKRVVGRNGPAFVAKFKEIYKKVLQGQLAKEAARVQRSLEASDEAIADFSLDDLAAKELQDQLLADLKALENTDAARIAKKISSLQKKAKEEKKAAGKVIVEIVDGKQTVRRAPLGSPSADEIKHLRETPEFREYRTKRAEANRRLKILDQRAKLSEAERAKQIERLRDAKTQRILDVSEKWRLRGADDFDIRTGKADFDAYAEDLAKDLRENILSYNAGLPMIDVVQHRRGPELQRMLNVPSEEIMEFLETDIEHLIRTYHRKVVPDIELTRSFGSPDATREWTRIKEEVYAKQAAAVDKQTKLGRTVEAERVRQEYEDQLQAIHRDMYAQIGRLRHVWGIPENPTGGAARMARVARNINTLRFMGKVAISSIPDVARPVMRHGLLSTMRHGVIPLIRDFKALRLSMNEARLAGTALDVILHTRAYQIADVMDQWAPGTRLERGLEVATSKIGIIAVFDYWNTAMKQFSGAIVNGQLMSGIADVMEGTASPRTIEFLASVGIDENAARRIWKEVQENGGGGKVNGVWFPNTESWQDPIAKRTYRAALVDEIDSTIVTPGLERPLWMDSSSLAFKLIGQFRSFAFSSTQKTLMAGLQQRDMAFFNGMMISLAFGMLSYYLYSMASGDKARKEMENAGLDRWADEAIARSGLTGIFGEVQRFAERVPLTQPYANFSQQRVARRGGDDLMSAALGPSFDLANTAFGIATGIDQPTQSTVSQTFNLLPYNNVFWAERIFKSIEDSVKDEFPERRQ